MTKKKIKNDYDLFTLKYIVFLGFSLSSKKSMCFTI